MLNGIEWKDIILDPIGIAGFALFLVFTVLSRTKNSAERRWLAPTFVGLAFMCLVGGFTIAFITRANTAAKVTVGGSITVEAHDGSAAAGVTSGPVTSISSSSVAQGALLNAAPRSDGTTAPQVTVEGDVTVNSHSGSAAAGVTNAPVTSIRATPEEGRR